jgi:hypothetical protein
MTFHKRSIPAARGAKCADTTAARSESALKRSPRRSRRGEYDLVLLAQSAEGAHDGAGAGLVRSGTKD